MPMPEPHVRPDLPRKPGHIDVGVNGKGEVVLTPGAAFRQLYLTIDQAEELVQSLKQVIGLAKRANRRRKKV